MTTKLAPVPNDDESENSEAFDKYDPELHTLSSSTVNVVKEQLAIKIRKPRKDEFVRVHPDPEYTKDYILLELEDGMDRLRYLVLPQFRQFVPVGLAPIRLHVTVNRAGEFFLWPIRLPLDNSGGARDWSDTALQCAERAKELWVRVVADKRAGYYEVHVAQADLGNPEWPQKSFRDLAELAFKGNVVDRADHPVIERLTGRC
jgi:hypothetical protein